MRKLFLFSLGLVLICMSASIVPAQEHDWGPWQLVSGNAFTGIDVCYAFDKTAWPTWYWKFHNRYHARVDVHYTWAADDGTRQPTDVMLDPDGTATNTNMHGRTHPNVIVTRAEVKDSGSPPAIKSGNTLEFPGPRRSPLPKPDAHKGASHSSNFDGWGSNPRAEGDAGARGWNESQKWALDQMGAGLPAHIQALPVPTPKVNPPAASQVNAPEPTLNDLLDKWENLNNWCHQHSTRTPGWNEASQEEMRLRNKVEVLTGKEPWDFRPMPKFYYQPD